jgi:hypothetical protein
MDLVTEIYQFLFISSIIFVVYILGNLALKMYGRFILSEDVTFELNTFEKIMLWISIALFFSYIIK